MSSVTHRRAAAPAAAAVSDSSSDDTGAVPVAFRSNESKEFFVHSLLMLVLLLCISATATYLYFRPSFTAASASAPDPARTMSASASASAALFDAVSKENLEGVEAALSKGDNPNALNAQGQAPLHVIVTKSFRNANTCKEKQTTADTAWRSSHNRKSCYVYVC